MAEKNLSGRPLYETPEERAEREQQSQQATEAAITEIVKQQEIEAYKLWLQEQRSRQARLIDKFFNCAPEEYARIRETIKLYFKNEGAPGVVKVITVLQGQKYCVKQLRGEGLARALKELLGDKKGLTRQNLNKLIDTSPSPTNKEQKDILSRIP